VQRRRCLIGRFQHYPKQKAPATLERDQARNQWIFIMYIENNIRASREQLRAEKERRRIKSTVAFYTGRIMALVQVLHKRLPPTVEDDVKRFVAEYLRQRPLQPGTMEQAALHEAGHYIAFEVEGMIAAAAEIYGSPGGHAGWGGGGQPRGVPSVSPMAPTRS
jgi:hypothetical protein